MYLHYDAVTLKYTAGDKAVNCQQELPRKPQARSLDAWVSFTFTLK